MILVDMVHNSQLNLPIVQYYSLPNPPRKFKQTQALYLILSL